jgi:CRP/FNR family cyclic AMP-dependent transcriptional regulator
MIILLRSLGNRPESSQKETLPMNERGKTTFDPIAFLTNAGLGRTIVHFKAKEVFFSQGNRADSIFYLQTGRAKLTVVSRQGKEATINLLAAGDFLGEASLVSAGGLHMASATALTAGTAMKVERSEMIRVMHEEHAFSDLFVKFLLARSMRAQEDLVDQLFSNSEKRLARILLLIGGIRQTWRTRIRDPKYHSRDTGGDDWNHPLARELLHESVSQAGLHRVQRKYPCSQIPPQCRLARLSRACRVSHCECPGTLTLSEACLPYSARSAGICRGGRCGRERPAEEGGAGPKGRRQGGILLPR